ncbi:endonuclease VII domain-containing protein [Nocardia grenadensis]|uniref:endonuclease VII domain-containing protein n=1 Tax=Nocardia grenadensis TaxID=931537 RepID=UPI000A046850|nr:endonuclease VII domain-containing protein [Nocardia grenadensis]
MTVRCIDCLTEGVTTSRPIHPDSGPRSPRCTTHTRAKKKSGKANAHDKMCQRTYGMAPGEYQRLYEFQGGRCYMCPRNGRTKKLAVDHDHSCCPETPTCGRCNRGLLCSDCNQLLGRTGDNPEFFHRGATYLITPPAQSPEFLHPTRRNP